MIDNPLSYVLIRPNVINSQGLQELVEHIKSSPAEDLSVLIRTKQMKRDKHPGLWISKPEILKLFQWVTYIQRLRTYFVIQ